VIELAGVLGVDVRNPVAPEHHGLAIDHEPIVFVLQRLGDPGITTAPVVTVAAEQAHYFTFALNDQAIAVVFDQIEPGRASQDAHLSRR
jgi:hypothetical protein